MAYRYLTIKVGGKTKLLHRDIMERHLGRPLQKNEHVHHRNGNPHDNRIENLEVLSVQQHAALHKQKYPLQKSCALCGTTFTPSPSKRKRAKSCSLRCARQLAWMKRRGVTPRNPSSSDGPEVGTLAA